MKRSEDLGVDRSLFLAPSTSRGVRTGYAHPAVKTTVSGSDILAGHRVSLATMGFHRVTEPSFLGCVGEVVALRSDK